MRRTIESFATKHEAEMIAFLDQLVSMQSGTANKAGVDAVMEYLEGWLREKGFATHIEPQSESGNILMAETPGSAHADKRVILSGHLDTVFPADTPFRHMTRNGDIAKGPGVIDMKGGVVVSIYALLAVLEAGRTDIPVRFLFSPDEEVSSRVMRHRLIREREGVAFALVFECAGNKGEVVRTRKGKVAFDVVFTGKAGHAAFVGAAKPSAILDMARKIPLLEALNSENPAAGNTVSVNAGKVWGGIGRNTVAEKAHLEMEIRSGVNETLEKTEKAALDILLASMTPEVTVEIVNRVTAPSVEAECTEVLYGLAADIARELGQEMGEDFRPGLSEAGWFAQAGIPVLDGLGPRGGKDHSTDEFIELHTLKERMILTALLLPKAWDTWKAGGMPCVISKGSTVYYEMTPHGMMP